MSSTIRIKRRITGSAGAPSSLKNAELAFNEIEGILYYGKGDDGAGTATSVIQVAGAGAFATITSVALLAASNTFTAGYTNTFNGTVNIASTFQIAGTTVTATASEINVLNNVTAGTIAASKAIVVDANKDITGLRNVTATGELKGASFANSNASFGVDSSGNVTNSGTISAAKSGSDYLFQVGSNGNVTVGTTSTNVVFTASTGAVTAKGAIKGYTFANSDESFTVGATGTVTSSGDFYAQTNKKLATEEYVNSVQQGLDVKQSVRVATTANITLSGTQMIDGIALSVGDRVLVKNQTTGTQNGIYVVAASSWSRATDASTSEKVTAGLFTFVSEGTQNADSGWILTADDAITLGTSSLTFVQFSGAGMITIDGASTASVTNGLEKDGNYLRLDIRLKRIANLAGVTANKLIYVSGTDAFDVTDFTALGRTLVGNSTASDMRTTLGLGSIATQSSSNVSITGGSISSVSIDLVTLDGGTF